MYTQNTINNGQSISSKKLARKYDINLTNSRKIVIGLILVVALLAFETFNYDTTRYALHSLLGDVNFMGLGWAVVLAIAFCAIDFAGLARLFTPEQGQDEPRAVWYLMGAWLLGATMNAIMTWWAVNLTLLNHDLGNEVLSRQELLRYVPIFVAVLVWLTRILFIGAFSIAGDQLFQSAKKDEKKQVMRTQQPVQSQKQPGQTSKNAPRPNSRMRTPTNLPNNVDQVPAGMFAQSQNREIN